MSRIIGVIQENANAEQQAPADPAAGSRPVSSER